LAHDKAKGHEVVIMIEELFFVIDRTRILFECLALVTDRGLERLDGFVFAAQGDQGFSPLFPYRKRSHSRY